MRVIVRLAFSELRGIQIEGECPAFDKKVDYKKTYDKRLVNIGFWLSDWKYAEQEGPNHTDSQVFIPWTSVLFMEVPEQVAVTS